MIRVNKISCILTGLLMLLLLACGKIPYYSETHAFADGTWGSGEMPKFSFEVKDSLDVYDMSFVLRLNTDYEYQNIWLLMHTTQPEGVMSTDTINILICDEKGKWLGKKSGANYTFTGVFALQHRFNTLGKHTIAIEHAVMNPLLKGVLDLSLVIEKSKG